MSNTNAKRFTQEQLSEILDLHWKWLRDEPDGVLANLWGADLTDADLTDADLRDANLTYANLWGADLTDADLRDANLADANLTGANLTGADLTDADLRDANLWGADLWGANLWGADLTDANLTGAKLPSPVIDLTGCKVGYKKVWNRDRSEKVVIELRFPEGTKLVSTVLGRKCRASEATVTRCLTPGFETETEFRSMHDEDFIYHVGETVKPKDPFDDSIAVECTSGIHFFTTREEAEEYYG